MATNGANGLLDSGLHGLLRGPPGLHGRHRGRLLNLGLPGLRGRREKREHGTSGQTHGIRVAVLLNMHLLIENNGGDILVVRINLSMMKTLVVYVQLASIAMANGWDGKEQMRSNAFMMVVKVVFAKGSDENVLSSGPVGSLCLRGEGRCKPRLGRPVTHHRTGRNCSTNTMNHYRHLRHLLPGTHPRRQLMNKTGSHSLHRRGRRSQ